MIIVDSSRGTVITARMRLVRGVTVDGLWGNRVVSLSILMLTRFVGNRRWREDRDRKDRRWEL